MIELAELHSRKERLESQLTLYRESLTSRVPLGTRIAIVKEKMKVKLRQIHPTAKLGSIYIAFVRTPKDVYVQWNAPCEVDYFHIMRMCSGFETPFCDVNCPVYAIGCSTPKVGVRLEVKELGVTGCLDIVREIPKAQLDWFIANGYIKVNPDASVSYEITCDPNALKSSGVPF